MVLLTDSKVSSGEIAIDVAVAYVGRSKFLQSAARHSLPVVPLGICKNRELSSVYAWYGSPENTPSGKHWSARVAVDGERRPE